MPGKSTQKYKTIKHYHEPGDLHEFTFSCYQRITLLTNNPIREELARAIDAAGERWQFSLVAFVFMPEHVHLLTLPADSEPNFPWYLRDIKRRVSVFQKAQLTDHKSRLVTRLTVPSGIDKGKFRMWEEGPGYDRNLNTCEAVEASIEYFHRNPVTRGLVQRAIDWRWSSAKFYATNGAHIDPLLPKITFLPREFWLSAKK